MESLPKPGWRNWQTQRTQNPPRATSWGFDPPSRHHRIKQLEEARTTWAVAVMAKYAQSMPELKKFGFVRCGFLPQM